jgi:rhamnosyltransferase
MKDFDWDEKLRNTHAFDLMHELGLFYIIPTTYLLADGAACGTEKATADLKVALLMHCYYPELFADARALAERMPAHADVYLTTNTEEKATQLRNAFQGVSGLIGVYVIPNRGRSESALIIELAKVAKDYDLCCFWKEKKSVHAEITMAEEWAKRIDDNLLFSPTYIENVLITFMENPRLGLLAPAAPNHSKLLDVLGHEWMLENYDNVLELYREMDLHVPISEDIPPLAPFGGAFWFRPEALRKLFEKGWTYEDFPAEPLKTDSTLLHAIERLYPFVVQDAGYYPAYVLNQEYAAKEILTLSSYVREYNKVLIDIGDTAFDIDKATENMRKHVNRSLRWRRVIKKVVPDKAIRALKGAKK